MAQTKAEEREKAAERLLNEILRSAMILRRDDHVQAWCDIVDVIGRGNDPLTLRNLASTLELKRK